MGMSPIDEQTLEIARRTRKNLEYLEACYCRGEPVYEFTQLFNSMLGMIICVREDYYKGGRIEWSDPHLQQLKPSQGLQGKSGAFSKLISNTRHAFAHSNYDFVINNDMKITGVKVWNLPDGAKDTPQNRTWNADFTEKELRELAFLAVNYLELMFGMTLNGEPSHPSDAPKKAED